MPCPHRAGSLRRHRRGELYNRGPGRLAQRKSVSLTSTSVRTLCLPAEMQLTAERREHSYPLHAGVESSRSRSCSRRARTLEDSPDRARLEALEGRGSR